jgi:hypothetical protein
MFLYLLQQASTCFGYISWPSSGSYKFGRYGRRIYHLVMDNWQAIFYYIILYYITYSCQYQREVPIYAAHVDQTLAPWRWPGYMAETCSRYVNKYENIVQVVCGGICGWNYSTFVIVVSALLFSVNKRLIWYTHFPLLLTPSYSVITAGEGVSVSSCCSCGRDWYPLVCVFRRVTQFVTWLAYVGFKVSGGNGTWMHCWRTFIFFFLLLLGAFA